MLCENGQGFKVEERGRTGLFTPNSLDSAQLGSLLVCPAVFPMLRSFGL